MKCKDCNKRTVGCHSTCPEYLEFKNMREQEHKLREQERDYNSYKSITVIKNTKKKHHI